LPQWIAAHNLPVVQDKPWNDGRSILRTPISRHLLSSLPVGPLTPAAIITAVWTRTGMPCVI
jgi:hypothetical protein